MIHFGYTVNWETTTVGLGAEARLLWTAPADGYYTATTAGSDYDTVLYLQNDSCYGSENDCNDDFGSTLQSAIGWWAYAGDSFVIVLDAYSENTTGNSQLNIFAPAIPGGWQCQPELYDDAGDQCDCGCGCGVADPDCAGLGCSSWACEDTSGDCDACWSGWEGINCSCERIYDGGTDPAIACDWQAAEDYCLNCAGANGVDNYYCGGGLHNGDVCTTVVNCSLCGATSGAGSYSCARRIDCD